jgi:hypothetical protein
VNVGAIIMTAISGATLVEHHPWMAGAQFMLSGWGIGTLVGDFHMRRRHILFLKIARMTQAYARWFRRLHSPEPEPWERDPDWWRQ